MLASGVVLADNFSDPQFSFLSNRANSTLQGSKGKAGFTSNGVLKKTHLWEFPGNPVIRTLPFHCRGPGSRN